MEQRELLPHLFRTEFGKIVSVLCKAFGIENMEIAEDLASDTFLTALQTWPYKGVPESPVRWLYSVAKNKALNYINRQRLFDGKITGKIKAITPEIEYPEIDLSDKGISDSQLQMLFVVCHPGISKESQIALSLRILCGFGIDEIASAFLTNKETINKRLFRSKEKLRLERARFEFPGKNEINKRLDIVLITLYLLFNEGYYSESNDAVLREDLCLEAMRLTYLLIEEEQTNKPDVNALFALMCFHASRFPARKNKNGELVLYQDQDEKLWNNELIAKGVYYLHQVSTEGNTLSKYHLEATIAYWNTQKTDTIEKWENILQLYNLLLQLEYSPVAALNRTYALSKVHGKQKAIIEAQKINMENNHYYFTLLGELYSGINNEKAKESFVKALTMARTNADKQNIKNRIASFIDK